jgi:putative mRNA 3-end processing factor
MRELLRLDPKGLCCPDGQFYVDPWRPVERAVITHAHSDHASWGCGSYLTSTDGERVLRARLGPEVRIESMPYGERRTINGVTVSLHPAGHILGSSQVRLEYGGVVWVVSGDYKTSPDPTCAPFEPVRCNGFISEATFGLPIYRWRPESEILAQVHEWWRANQAEGKASLLLAYSLGKAQRLLAGLDPEVGPIFHHGSLERINAAYRAAGIPLAPSKYAASVSKADWGKALIVGPPSVQGTPWLRRFGEISTAFASGWMQIRGARRRRSVDRGFALSDHADWPGLLSAIDATGAECIWVTHGATGPLVRWLTEQGRDARALATRYEGEQDEAGDPVSAGDAPESGAEA